MTNEEYEELRDNFMKSAVDLFKFNKLDYSPVLHLKTPKSFELLAVDKDGKTVDKETFTSRDLDKGGTKAMFKLARLISWLDLNDM